jgi:hypothetical protein
MYGNFFLTTIAYKSPASLGGAINRQGLHMAQHGAGFLLRERAAFCKIILTGKNNSARL